MKKLLISFLLATLFSTVLYAQNPINDSNIEKRAVSGFHGIEVSTGIELTLTEGNTEELAVSAATSQFRDKIITKVENGILKIYYESKTKSINKKGESKNLKAYVSYKKLDLLLGSTGAEVKIHGILKSASLNMEASTGGLINGEVDITSLKISQNTGSKITLTGIVDKLDINGRTGSKFNGEDMNTATCNVSVSTGAIVSVKANNELQVTAHTGGRVKYKGNPSLKAIKKNTGGIVNKI
jgi:hypothetical protein